MSRYFQELFEARLSFCISFYCTKNATFLQPLNQSLILLATLLADDGIAEEVIVPTVATPPRYYICQLCT